MFFLASKFKKMLIFYRTILTGLGFLDGNWEELKDKSSRVTLIEPVVEAVMQLFFQFLIVLIIFGPNLDKGDHIYIINY